MLFMYFKNYYKKQNLQYSMIGGLLINWKARQNKKLFYFYKLS